MLLALPATMAACGSDNNGSDVSAAVSDAVADVSSAADGAVADVSSAADSVTDDNSDEGKAKDLANQIVTKLQAMPQPGEPLMASINDATKDVAAPDKVTGISDDDNDGKDDDAKFTVETNDGNDKACVQSQNGAWEVTDDQC